MKQNEKKDHLTRMMERYGFPRTNGSKSLLINADAVDALEPMNENYVDLTMTSPPYDDLRTYGGHGWNWTIFTKIAHQLFRVTKPGGVVVWVVADRTHKGSESFTSIRQAIYFRDQVGFNAHDTMVYHRATPPQTRRRYEQWWEYMFVFCKPKKGQIGPNTFNGIKVPKSWPETKPRSKPKTFGRWRDDTRDDDGYIKYDDPNRLDSNVWKINMGQRDPTKTYLLGHPAPYPEELVLRHIHTWTNPGDIVLDPMMGSCTTGEVAKAMGRNFIGIEVHEPYIQSMALRRMGLRTYLKFGESNGTRKNSQGQGRQLPNGRDIHHQGQQGCDTRVGPVVQSYDPTP